MVISIGIVFVIKSLLLSIGVFGNRKTGQGALTVRIADDTMHP
jgi:hypothetical protein